MFALREAVLGLLLGASFGPAMALAQAPARPPAAPADATPKVPPPPAKSGQPSTSAPPTGASPGATNGSPTETPPVLPPAIVTPPGSVGGQLLLLRGGMPKHGVVYLESVPPSSWSVPRERVALSLRGAHFVPDFLVVPVGQTVQITNADRLVHSPFSVSPGKPFELSRHAAGESHTLTLDRPGIVDLFCNIHETMQGMIVVLPSTFYSVPAPDGSFQIGGVPPGRYHLIGYSPEAETATQAIEVRSRERAVIKLQLGPLGQTPPSPAVGPTGNGRERLK